MAIIGRPAKRHSLKLCFAGVPMLAQLGSFVIFQAIRANIAKKPFFAIFRGGGGGSATPVSLLDPPMYTVDYYLQLGILGHTLFYD